MHIRQPEECKVIILRDIKKDCGLKQITLEFDSHRYTITNYEDKFKSSSVSSISGRQFD